MVFLPRRDALRVIYCLFSAVSILKCALSRHPAGVRFLQNIMALLFRREGIPMISERLAFLRGEAGKTQDEVADELHMARSTYGSYETGRRISIEELYAGNG